MTATTLSVSVNEVAPTPTEPTLSEDSDSRPALVSLFVELSRDATEFAKAEVAYLKVQASERVHFAMPGFVMIGVAIAIATGVLMAVPVGCIMLLTPLIGLGWSLLAVTVAGIFLAYVMIKLGTRRLKSTLKSPEDR